MKKKGSFLSGLVVFILIIIILGGVGYLGFNIINNANGMTGMNMASDTTSKDSGNTDTSTTDTGTTDTVSSVVSNETANSNTNVVESTYKINQINQVMISREALKQAYNTINSALQKMTLDPYAVNAEASSSMSSQMSDQLMSDTQSDASSSSQGNTNVNIYTGSVTAWQTSQIQNMGQTYDANKMQQLHSGLYKVSVGMQLLNQLQEDITAQIEKAGVDTSTEQEYYINQYYKTVQNKNNLNDALSYINEAVDLININPYVDANGLVYDEDRMTQLHDSIYLIAQGVVDLNKLNGDLLSQSVNLGTLAQEAYNKAQLEIQKNMDTTTTMNMATGTNSSFNVSTIITVVLIAFVVIFIIGFLGSIMNLFKSDNQRSTINNPE